MCQFKIKDRFSTKKISHEFSFSFKVHTFEISIFLTGIHSMQDYTATIRDGVIRKELHKD